MEETEITVTRRERHSGKRREETQSRNHSPRLNGDAPGGGGGGQGGGSAAGSQDGSSSDSGNYKRLIVCCDGTWLDSDSGLKNGKIIPPSNVTRMTRAIKSESSNGIQQIVYYQAGVGSMGTVGNKVIGGISGDGLAEHVREGYSFIANNFNMGDQIFLIGFSRGAYTARAIAGLVDNIGVLTKKGLASFPVIYKDFARRHDRSYRTPQPDIPFRNKPSARDPEYARQLKKRGLTKLGVPVKAIGVFDTVGSLGVPSLGWLGRIKQQTTLAKDVNEYRFYDTSLGNNIENAFQALALDERREAFQPTLWEKRGDNQTNLIQVWFPGVHANIGGGYDDQELSNITLAWMMAMLSPLLDLDTGYITTQEHENGDYYEDTGQKLRPWSFGKIYDSATGLFALGGKVIRTPGEYMRIDYRTAEQTNRPLKNTNEYIHASVRSRFNLQGPGYADRGVYDPKALRPWTLKYEPGIKNMPTSWYWSLDGAHILPEAPLRPVEKILLKNSPDVEEEVYGDPKKNSRDDDRRGGRDDDRRRDRDDRRAGRDDDRRNDRDDDRNGGRDDDRRGGRDDDRRRSKRSSYQQS